MNKLLPSVKSLITLAALLCFLFQASAASAQKVSLSVRNATVKAAIERLQKDYGYSFVIKTKDADVNKKITLDVKNEEIGAVVGKMFAGQNVVSSVEGKMIAIMSAPAKRDAAARASANAVVKGVVKDSAGNPITGATVIVDGTTIGATTDLDGSFSVRIGARTDVRLIVSYLGLKTREVAVDDPARFYEVRLENDNMALDEVVVVGYGTQRRSLVTNAISQFKPTEENMRSVMSPSELLQGRIAGVSISTSSGNLGSAEKMSIRGSSSLSASNEPLYVIDGIPLSNNSASLYSFGENMSSLATLNLTDIESIEVLKDAASAAIYGSRATNGVVLITTKQGREGKSEVKVNYGFSITQFPNTGRREYVGSKQYVEVFNEGVDNYNRQNGFTVNSSGYVKPIRNPYGDMPDTDWLDLITRLGQSHCTAPQKLDTFGVFFMKYNYEIRLKAVKLVLEGGLSVREAGCHLGCGRSQVHLWVTLFERHGLAGLKLRHGSYSAEFKLSVLKHMHQNHLSLLETAVHFGIPGPFVIRQWERLYQNQGAEGLRRKPQRRRPAMSKSKTKKVKLKTTPHEELLKELEYLRAENAYLKKLQALVEERIVRESGKEPKPSKD